MISCQRRPLQTAPVFVFVRLNHRTPSWLKFWPWTQNQFYDFKNNYQFNCVLFNVFLILFLYRDDNTNILLYQILRKCCKMFVIFTWRVFLIREILYCIYSLSFYKQLLIFSQLSVVFIYLFLNALSGRTRVRYCRASVCFRGKRLLCLLLHGIRLTQLGFLAHDLAAKSLFSSLRAKVAESRTRNQLRELG